MLFYRTACSLGFFRSVYLKHNFSKQPVVGFYLQEIGVGFGNFAFFFDIDNLLCNCFLLRLPPGNFTLKQVNRGTVGYLTSARNLHSVLIKFVWGVKLAKANWNLVTLIFFPFCAQQFSPVDFFCLNHCASICETGQSFCSISAVEKLLCF